MMIVYFYHCECYLGFNKSEIYHFYSPFFINAFFFITGYLIFRKELSKGILSSGANNLRDESYRYLANVFFRITIPTLIFASCLYLPKVVLGMKVDFVNDVLLGGASWFTTSLSVAEVIILFLLMTRLRNIWFYVLATTILLPLAIWLSLTGVTNLYYFQSGLSATVLIALGGLYYSYETILDRVLRWYILIPLALVYIILVIMYKDSIHWSIYGIDFSFIGFICTILSILVIVSVSKKILRAYSQIDFIGNNTLAFYLLCGAIPNIICMLLCKTNLDTLYLIPLTFIFSIGFAYYVVYITVKYLPWLLDIRKLKI